VDTNLLEAAITKFDALGFAVAHTGSYHTALFAKDTHKKTLESYREYVLKNSAGIGDEEVQVFDTAQAADRRVSM